MYIEEKKNFQTSQDSKDTFFPKSELEISNIIKNFGEKNIPLEIVGSGSKKFIGKKLQCEKTLNLSLQICLYNPYPLKKYLSHYMQLF